MKLLIAALAAAALSCPARAAIYTLENISYSPDNPAGFGYLDSGVSLTIADAAVASGSFNFTYINSRQTTGGLADFISVNTPSDGVNTSRLNPSDPSPIGTGQFALTFDPSGNVLSVGFNFHGVNDDVSFTGTGASVSGSFSSDQSVASACGVQPNLCTFTAQFVETSPTSVPEPMSLALLLTPLAAVIRARNPKDSRDHQSKQRS